MRYILSILILAAGLLGMGGCDTLSNVEQWFITDHYIVVIDQTLSTKELRSHPAIYQFLRALGTRPNLDVEIYGMTPDRVYRLYLRRLQDALKEDFGRIGDGTYTGGDLQNAIDFFDNADEKGIIIITDGEYNFGNIPTTLPRFLHPEKFYLIGIRENLYQAYSVIRGLSICQVDGVPDLTRQLIEGGGRLRDFNYKIEIGGHNNDRTNH